MARRLNGIDEGQEALDAMSDTVVDAIKMRKLRLDNPTLTDEEIYEKLGIKKKKKKNPT